MGKVLGDKDYQSRINVRIRSLFVPPRLREKLLSSTYAIAILEENYKFSLVILFSKLARLVEEPF